MPDKTLILLEEVDTINEEDKGFAAELADMIVSTKRPILLTSNIQVSGVRTGFNLRRDLEEAGGPQPRRRRPWRAFECMLLGLIDSCGGRGISMLLINRVTRC